MSMPSIQIDPALVEKAVFHACRASDALERQLHQAVDALYELPQGAARDRAFHEAYLDLFQRIGLHAAIADLLEQRAELVERVTRCLVCEALQVRDERIEVLASAAREGQVERTLVIHITAEHMASPREFHEALRRDLLHASDIVDEHFDFRREDLLGNEPEDNLVRDRYHVLWRMYVESRLPGEGDMNDGEARRLWAALHRVYPGYDPAMLDAAVARQLLHRRVTHRELLAYARHPDCLVTARQDGREPSDVAQPAAR